MNIPKDGGHLVAVFKTETDWRWPDIAALLWERMVPDAKVTFKISTFRHSRSVLVRSHPEVLFNLPREKQRRSFQLSSQVVLEAQTFAVSMQVLVATLELLSATVFRFMLCGVCSLV